MVAYVLLCSSNFFCVSGQIKSHSKTNSSTGALKDTVQLKVIYMTLVQLSKNTIYEHLVEVANGITLPGGSWIVYLRRDLYLMFAKADEDKQLSFQVLIHPDMKTDIYYYSTVLPWLQADIKSEENLTKILQTVDKLRLPRLMS